MIYALIKKFKNIIFQWLKDMSIVFYICTYCFCYYTVEGQTNIQYYLENKEDCSTFA
jgi:hypothetical protein